MSYPRTQKHFLPFVLLGCVLLLLTPLVLAGWPVNVLVVRAPSANGPVEILRVPSLLGRDVTANIIHSVQLTPVHDTYRVQEGRLWTWEERIRSHSAGLPSMAPHRGRFLYDPPWMLVQGAASAVDPLYYRVGTEDLGKNVLCVFTEDCLVLWALFPGKRLEIGVVSGRLYSSTSPSTLPGRSGPPASKNYVICIT